MTGPAMNETRTLDTTGEQTLTSLLADRVENYGQRDFLVFEAKDGQRTTYTYAEFQRLVTRCARGLHLHGVERGDFIVIHLTNCPEFLIAWFAFARLGAVFVPSNVANTTPELMHILEVTNPRLVVTEPAFAETVRAAVDATSAAAGIVTARGPVDGAIPFEALMADDGEPPAVEVGSDDLAELIFTSGTVKQPKPVMLTHANCVRAGLHSVHALWLDEGERALTALPLFHVNAQALSLLGTLTVAGTLVLLEEFRATKYWRQVREHEATTTCLVAMQLRTLVRQPPADGERDHKVRKLFYAINVTDREKEEFERRYGVTLINGYGMTETMTLLCCSPVVGSRRWPSIGLPAPGRRLRLLDVEGNDVKTGEVGEIVVVGVPGRDVFLGYYNDPAATAEVLREDGLHTGDNAYADEHGFLYFFDRKKDMIKRAGENVSALEVEAAIQEHPSVAEVAVVGVPDAIRDEAVAAAIVPLAGADISPDEITEWCRARLSKFKVPTVVVVVAELPKTSIGKVRKSELRKDLAPVESPAGAER
jgi:crotonobetaine/carnitine-CoA ligase